MGKFEMLRGMIMRCDPRVASVRETPPHIARMVASRIPPDSKKVLEFGGGAGAISEEILKWLNPGNEETSGEKQLLIFETNAYLRRRMLSRLPGVREKIIGSDMCFASKFVPRESVDAIVSGVPYSAMHRKERKAAIADAHVLLKPGGVFIAYQIRDAMYQAMQEIFEAIGMEVIERRIPFVDPKYIFTGRKKSAESECDAAGTELSGGPTYESARG